MSQDIKIKTDDYSFKYRVSGLLIKDNKVLTVQINDNGFYCLPGGHVELMETSKDAIVREFYEETRINVKVERLVYVTENFFNGKLGKFHEIGMYYLLSNDNIKIEDYTLIEHDKNDSTKLEFKWIDICNLENFKPEFIKNEILNINKDKNIKHFVIRNDNEKS